MGQLNLDQTGSEQDWQFIAKLKAMFTELYASVAANAAASVSGEATSASLVNAAGAQASITITDAKILATSKVFVSIKNGTNTQGAPALVTVTPGAGSAVAVVQNIHASQAFNGTLKLEYFVVV
jgi:hypothetical protein